MAEESSQQFTSTGTTSARNVSPTKASSVRPVNRQPIRQVSSNTQSPQTKYIYAGIGEQPLTQREFDENLKNLRSTLAEVESLLHGDMKNPENIKRCQQLLGFATSLRLPQEVKDKEIRSYPPAVQHLYETVKNEGSSASPAAQMAQTRHATTAMAQIMASDAHTVADLKAAIANGWDINAKHLNPDGSYSTYVDYQGKVLSETAAFDERLIARLDEIMAMPDGPEKERALKEHQAAADANHQTKMQLLGNLNAAVQSGKLNQEELNKTSRIFAERRDAADKHLVELEKRRNQAETPQEKEEVEKEITQTRKEKSEAEKGLGQANRMRQNMGFETKGDRLKKTDPTGVGNATPFRASAADANHQTKMQLLGNLNAAVQSEELNQEELNKASRIFAERRDAADKHLVELEKRRNQAETPQEKEAVEKDITQTLKEKSEAKKGLGQAKGMSQNMGFETEENGQKTDPTGVALASMGCDRGMDDLNLGITPGGKVGLMPKMPCRRSTGFNRNAIASTNRGFDLGTVGLVSTTTPKVPQTPVKDATESKIAVSKQTDMDNSLEKNNTHNLATPKKGIADLNASLEGASSGKPINLEADINILNIRSQQSQATV